jgi:hypothetical protein
VFPTLDYARLKRSFEYFVEHYVPAERITPGSHPVKLLERDEPSRMSRARRALAVAVADFVEGTQDFCLERVSEIDRDLQKRDAYTLSFCVSTSQRDVIGSNQSNEMFDVGSATFDLASRLPVTYSFR